MATSCNVVPKVVVMQNILLYRLENQMVDPKTTSEPNSERKSSTDVKRILNKTYNIEPEQDAPCESVLNTAFLETESDLIFPVTPDPKDGSWPSWHRRLSQEHNIQRDVWSEPDSPWPEWDPDYVGMPEVSDAKWQNRAQKHHNPVNPPQSEAGQFYSGVDYNAGCAGCPCGDVWSQDVEEQFINEGNICDGLDVYSEIYKQTDKCPQTQRPNTAFSTEDIRLTSYETFMLGAAAAPHSSEVDLRTGLTKCGCAKGNCLSAQERAVGVAMAIHLNALRRLWVKAQELKQDNPCCQSFSHRWDLPTRDPGPSTPTTPYKRGETFVKDPFVADSLKNTDRLQGKGRERLKSRPGVIGIRMGRQ